MSFASIDRLRHSLGFRLAAWYAVVFVGSSLALTGLTYLLLASSLRQRDRQLIESTLDRYAAAYERRGLPGLNLAIGADRAAGRNEPLLVRVLGRGQDAVFLSMPADWSKFDLTQLSQPPLLGAQAWAELSTVDGDAVLEVGSALLPDGTLFQVGRSTEERGELLRRFRSVVLLVSLSIVVFGEQETHTEGNRLPRR